MEWNVKQFEERVLDPKKIKLLNKLQEEILRNCLNLVKEKGGIVYYATCSLSKAQNEDIIEKCIKGNKKKYTVLDALEALECKMELLEDPQYGVEEGFIEGTYRFSPNSLSTGGLFLAKIRRNY